MKYRKNIRAKDNKKRMSIASYIYVYIYIYIYTYVIWDENDSKFKIKMTQ